MYINEIKNFNFLIYSVIEITSKNNSYYLLASWKYELIVVELHNVNSYLSEDCKKFLKYIDSNSSNFQKDIKIHILINCVSEDFIDMIKKVHLLLNYKEAKRHFFYRWANPKDKKYGEKLEQLLDTHFTFKKI